MLCSTDLIEDHSWPCLAGDRVKTARWLCEYVACSSNVLAAVHRNVHDVLHNTLPLQGLCCRTADQRVLDRRVHEQSMGKAWASMNRCDRTSHAEAHGAPESGRQIHCRLLVLGCLFSSRQLTA